MPPTLSLLAILNLIGAAHATLLSLALLSLKRGNRTANRLLAALTATIAIVITGGVLRTSHYEFIYPHLSSVHDPFGFLLGPLLYLYIRALSTRRTNFAGKDYLHFIPFALCVLCLAPFYVQSGTAKIERLLADAYSPSLGAWYYARSACLLLQSGSYIFAGIVLLIKYTRNLQRPVAVAERNVLLQVRFIVGGFLLLFMGGLLRYTLDQTSRTNLLVPLGGSVFIYTLGYLGLRRPELLSGATEQAPAATVGSVSPAKKYQKSTLTPERSERYLKKLLHYMETEKLYVDGELTLPALAARLSISPPHLSQIINERLRQNFVDFVNGYRVAEAKRRLRDPAKQHYSVLAIAEEVGFNSKSSFNAVFKKHANMTPSEFRKAINGAH